MAFDPNKPLTFQLPDGQCEVITVQYLESLLNDYVVPITAAVQAIGGQLDRIDERCQEWLDDQQQNGE